MQTIDPGMWFDLLSGISSNVCFIIRFEEAKCELDGLLKDDSMANVPILVLGNKIDMPRAASEQV